jgi:hypothetical protein
VRSVLATTAAAVLLLAAATACAGAPPAGTDGDLLDGWATMPRPAPFRPAAGECHETLVEIAAMAGHWISYHPTRTEWQQGERRVRCFLWFSDRKVTRSLAGAGPSALPVR